jgi:hypothetical protein
VNKFEVALSAALPVEMRDFCTQEMLAQASPGDVEIDVTFFGASFPRSKTRNCLSMGWEMFLEELGPDGP